MVYVRRRQDQGDDPKGVRRAAIAHTEDHNNAVFALLRAIRSAAAEGDAADAWIIHNASATVVGTEFVVE